MADIEAEREMSRSELADYLRRFADELDTTTDTATRTEHQSETPDTPEDEQHQRDETHSASASEGEPSDESGVLDSLADDDHENEEVEDQRDRSDRDRSDESGQSPRKVTFMVGNESTTINPPETVAFEMAVDSESSVFGSETGRTAQFALHWDVENVSDDNEFSVQ